MSALRAARGAVAAAVAFFAQMPANADGREDAGAAVYARNCARCHGDHADGVSRMSFVLNIKPPNLRTSRLGRVEQERIVRLGGEGVGRSALMPIWGDTLDAAQIDAVVDYLQTIRGARAGSP